MKLRSGKELPERVDKLPEYVDKLPENLDNLLEDRLQEFKKTFSGNLEHAKELLHIISQSRSISSRVPIRAKVEEAYDDKLSEGVGPLLGIAGNLAWVLVDNPMYHDIIHTRIKNFDLEADLLGNLEG